MSFDTNIQNLTTALSTVLKTHKTLINGNAADLSALTTSAKNNLVAALNEVKAGLTSLQQQVSNSTSINDAAATSSTTETYSVSKIVSTVDGKVSAAITALTDNAPAALDTLKELADAVNNDSGFAGKVLSALDNRVRIDTATQGLTATQQANARANIGTVSAADIGSTTTDYVAILSAGLI